ncbi:MAG: phage tail tape measure protein [Pseudomonadota bacterium]
MTDRDRIEDLGEQSEALADGLSAAATTAATFGTELSRMREALDATAKDAATLERGLSRGLRKAFDGLVFDGKSLSDAMSTVAETLSRTAYNAALRPVTDHVGGAISQGVTNLVQGVLPFAKGGSFSQGRVMPFANGGVVSGPTTFPMRGGMGLMGEAGPEAIMPLTRGADGKLGVRAAGGGQPVQVVMNISTPDAQSFQRSQGQVAAQLSRAISRGNRNR